MKSFFKSPNTAIAVFLEQELTSFKEHNPYDVDIKNPEEASNELWIPAREGYEQGADFFAAVRRKMNDEFTGIEYMQAIGYILTLEQQCKDNAESMHSLPTFLPSFNADIIAGLETIITHLKEN